MKHIGAIINNPDTGRLLIRYSRSLYGNDLKRGVALEIKTDTGWAAAVLDYDEEGDRWFFKDQPYRYLPGLIVRTTYII